METISDLVFYTRATVNPPSTRLGAGERTWGIVDAVNYAEVSYSRHRRCQRNIDAALATQSSRFNYAISVFCFLIQKFSNFFFVRYLRENGGLVTGAARKKSCSII